jgi:hypothetical protein
MARFAVCRNAALGVFTPKMRGASRGGGEARMVTQGEPSGASAYPASPGSGARAAHTERGQKVGAQLEDVRGQLAVLLDSLDRVLGEHAAPLINEAKRQLASRCCRIAVIGQVKAGKSTFINAFAERPGLLPTHINPWTAVVCSLHFRNSDAQPEHAAEFHLFSAEEWNQLAQGGGHLRELTERLIPGFQPELLRAQLEVMRTRAERRLGGDFDALLGQTHRFKELTPELIAEYVSAGDEYQERSPERRLYSDITRSADLYFNDGPFSFPLTLIDTPGTNDPFLVRDEITRRSLEDPDIYVFVISALQPLAVSDIAMLRLLNGLHKDRIVVFINRADQLPNPKNDAPIIKAAVEKRLSLEFPALRIPVIWGSALLGCLMLETGGDEEGRSRWSAEGGVAAAEVGSGMREVSAAITRMMGTSGIAMLLRQIAACVAGLVKSAEVTDSAEIAAIEGSLIASVEDATALRTRVAEEQKSVAVFEERAEALRKSFREVGEHLSAIVDLGCSMLRTQLRDTVRDYADEQADALLHALPRNRHWQCDVAPLRERLESNYLVAIERIAAELGRVEQFLYPHLRGIVSGLLPDYQGDLLEAPAWLVEPGPSTAALSRRVATDLGAGWWQRWLAARRPPIDRANQLRRLIQLEFFALVEELAQGAEKHLNLRVDYTMQRANAIGAGLRMGIDQRRDNLAGELTLLSGAGDEEALARFEREQRERASICVARRAVYASALDQLGDMLERLDAIYDA